MDEDPLAPQHAMMVAPATTMAAMTERMENRRHARYGGLNLDTSPIIING
jgi:hypothetical protein